MRNLLRRSLPVEEETPGLLQGLPSARAAEGMGRPATAWAESATEQALVSAQPWQGMACARPFIILSGYLLRSEDDASSGRDVARVVDFLAT